MTKLKALWYAMLGRSDVGNQTTDQEFYEKLASFKSVVDSNTQTLRAEHEAMEKRLTVKIDRVLNEVKDANK